MNWSDIGKIVATTMLSLGGAGIIIAVVIKFSAEKIAERLSAKYELKLNKELETYKSDLEKKNYISGSSGIMVEGACRGELRCIERSRTVFARILGKTRAHP